MSDEDEKVHVTKTYIIGQMPGAVEFKGGGRCNECGNYDLHADLMGLRIQLDRMFSNTDWDINADEYDGLVKRIAALREALDGLTVRNRTIEGAVRDALRRAAA